MGHTPFPIDTGTVANTMQGTTLFTDPNETHSLNHRQIGSVINSLPTVFGTFPTTGLFSGYQTGWAPLAFQGGTLQAVISKGTINNGILGSPTITGGTLNSNIQNNGTINGGGINPNIGTFGTLIVNNGTMGSTVVLTPIKSSVWAQPGTQQVFAASSTGTVTLGSLILDTLSEFGTATSSFIPLQSGIYEIVTMLNFNSASFTSPVQTKILLNGITIQASRVINGEFAPTFWIGSITAGGTVIVTVFLEQGSGNGTLSTNPGVSSFFAKRVF